VYGSPTTCGPTSAPAAGQRPASAFLGDLVEKEVRRYRERRIRKGSADDQELLDALDDARALHGELVTVIERLERRLNQQAVKQSPRFDELA
jgi:hypothetical protein